MEGDELSKDSLKPKTKGGKCQPFRATGESSAASNKNSRRRLSRNSGISKAENEQGDMESKAAAVTESKGASRSTRTRKRKSAKTPPPPVTKIVPVFGKKRQANSSDDAPAEEMECCQQPDNGETLHSSDHDGGRTKTNSEQVHIQSGEEEVMSVCVVGEKADITSDKVPVVGELPRETCMEFGKDESVDAGSKQEQSKESSQSGRSMSLQQEQNKGDQSMAVENKQEQEKDCSKSGRSNTSLGQDKTQRDQQHVQGLLEINHYGKTSPNLGAVGDESLCPESRVEDNKGYAQGKDDVVEVKQEVIQVPGEEGQKIDIQSGPPSKKSAEDCNLQKEDASLEKPHVSSVTENSATEESETNSKCDIAVSSDRKDAEVVSNEEKETGQCMVPCNTNSETSTLAELPDQSCQSDKGNMSIPEAMTTSSALGRNSLQGLVSESDVRSDVNVLPLSEEETGDTNSVLTTEVPSCEYSSTVDVKGVRSDDAPVGERDVHSHNTADVRNNTCQTEVVNHSDAVLKVIDADAVACMESTQPFEVSEVDEVPDTLPPCSSQVERPDHHTFTLNATTCRPKAESNMSEERGAFIRTEVGHPAYAARSTSADICAQNQGSGTADSTRGQKASTESGTASAESKVHVDTVSGGKEAALIGEEMNTSHVSGGQGDGGAEDVEDMPQFSLQGSGDHSFLLEGDQLACQMMELTDSQMMELDEQCTVQNPLDENASCSSANIPAAGCKHVEKAIQTHATHSESEDSTAVVQGMIRDLKQLNSTALDIKRQIENFRRERRQAGAGSNSFHPQNWREYSRTWKRPNQM